jgi:hypothetical protein
MKKMTNTLEKLLVIEDDPRHLEEAKEFFSTVPGLNVEYATTLEEAINSPSYGGDRKSVV